MSDNSNSTAGGISFLSLLGLLFIGLKLGRVIDWEWLWVLSPLWIPVAAALGIVVLAFVLAAIVSVFRAIYRAVY